MDAAFSQMFHQTQKEGQVLGCHPLFVQGQEEGAAVGLQIEIGILDAFGDALEGERFADVVLLEQAFQIFKTDVGIDGHSDQAPALKPRESLMFAPAIADSPAWFFWCGMLSIWGPLGYGPPPKSGAWREV